MLQWEHSAILATFIKLPFVINIFVWSTFKWPFYTFFIVLCILYSSAILSLGKRKLDALLFLSFDNQVAHFVLGVFQMVLWVGL